MDFCKEEFKVFTDKENDYLFEVSHPHMRGHDFRYTDGTAHVIYRFPGTIGQKSYLLLDIGSEYRVFISSYGQEWKEVMNFFNTGRWSDRRPVCLTPFFAVSDTVYLKICDAVPEDGNGGAWNGITYYFKTDAAPWEDFTIDISEGWLANGLPYNAGTALMVENGQKVDFCRQINIPVWWGGEKFALSFSWIECQGQPSFYINNEQSIPLYKSGKNFVLALPQDTTGQTIELRVVLSPKNGVCGLWRSVRAGLTELVTFPEAVRSFGEKSYQLVGNYDTSDLITLNALSGNYLSALIRPEHKLLGFSSETPILFSHDSSRAILALADEERYSPVVHLEAIQQLYDGVKASFVPGSDYELFLKYDFRYCKMIKPREDRPDTLTWFNRFDTEEYLADLRIALPGQDKPLPMKVIKKEEKTLECRFDAGKGAVEILAEWHEGTSDKPLTVSITTSCIDGFDVLIDDFDNRFYDYRYSSCRVGTAEVCKLPVNDIAEIHPKEEKYLLLISDGDLLLNDRNLGRNAAHLLTWQDTPAKIIIKTNEEGVCTEIRLCYRKQSTTVITWTAFWYFDPSCAWPLRVAENLTRRGVFGAGGYDPTYTCGAEGLGTAALAAAAYIFNKYGVPGAEQTEQIAKKAMDAALKAAREKGYIPIVMYDRVSACDYLVRLGHTEYVAVAAYWASHTLNLQNPDGSFKYFDARFVMTLQRAYEITGEKRFAEAVSAYRKSVDYQPDLVRYGVDMFYPHWLRFAGAVELSYLGHMGDIDGVKNVIEFCHTLYDDSGIFDCSDLNPYMLGWSMKGFMKKTYRDDELKHVLAIGEYAMYDNEGNFTIQDYPTAYIREKLRGE